jgi:hypothetical protein
MRCWPIAPLVGGLAPMLGNQHIRVMTIRGFPNLDLAGDSG